MQNSPRQPKRDFNAERKSGARIGGRLRMAGKAFLVLGKTLTQSQSHRDVIAKKHGKSYGGPFGPRGEVISVQKAKNWLAATRLPPHIKKAIEYMIEGRDPGKKWSPSKKGLTEADIRGAYEGKFKKIGEKQAQEIMKALTLDDNSAHGMFAGGKQVSLEKVKERLAHARNLRPEERVIGEIMIENLMPKYEHSLQSGITQPKMIDIVNEAERRFGRNVVTEIDRAYGAEYAEGHAQSKIGPRRPEARERVGLHEGLLPGWARRPKEDDEDEEDTKTRMAA